MSSKKIQQGAIITLFLTFGHVAFGQNLISNPGFETHKKLSQYYHFDIIDLDLKDWIVYDKAFSTFVCDSTYKERNKVDEKLQFCTMNTPRSGKSMMQLQYTSSCNSSGETSEYAGCSDYLVQKLSTPLKIGSVYKVSLWLYWDDIYANEDMEAMHHFGVITSYDRLPIDKYNKSFIRKNPLPIDVELVKEKWILLEWYIQPTCIQNYLTLGIFKGDKKWWGSIHDKFAGRTIYYVDDVSVMEVSEAAIPSNVELVYFCNEYVGDEQAEIRYQKVVLFGANSDEPVSFDPLKTICENSEKDATYILSGFTDSIGVEANNFGLSKRRIASVEKYLLANSSIKVQQIIRLPWGQRRPFAENNTKSGRAQNRRVTITKSTVSKSIALYRNALVAIEKGDKREASRLLNGWSMNAPNGELILAYFDPRIQTILQSREGQFVRKKIAESYNRFEHPSLSLTLDSLYCADQMYRTLLTYIQDLGGFFEGYDEDWNLKVLTDEEFLRRDSNIFLSLMPVIDKYGYPNISEVGSRQAAAAGLIIIHSSDTLVLEKYLPILEEKCTKGEAVWRLYILMFDRLRLLKEEPQRYGTQYLIGKDGQKKLWQLEDPEKVNIWRKQLGIIPLEVK